jgi:predicted O-linked N-acetylglucosamine transferase (SPINDLY family)
LYQEILTAAPEHPDALCMLGLMQHQQGRTEMAVALMRRAIRSQPNGAELWMNLGNLLKVLGSWDEAAESYREALRLRPGSADVCNNLGNLLANIDRMDEALAYYEQGRRLSPNDADIHTNIGAALRKQGHLTEAIASYRVAVALQPRNATALTNLGNALNDAGDTQNAIAAYRDALAVAPGHTAALAGLVRRQYAICDWNGIAELEQRLLSSPHLESGQFNLFNFLSLGATPQQQLKAAAAFARREFRGIRKIELQATRASGRVRIGYVSADFRDHPVASLVAELFELHDRSRYETFGYANYGRHDTSEIRQRIASAFEHFVDIEGLAPQSAAERIAQDGIDILVDLTGYTKHSPGAILARRPARIQVSYLGYPGTTGSSFVDYVITEKFITPPERQDDYSERFVYMPHCFQVNDRKKAIADLPLDRQAHGLGNASFVFCCFNQTYKLTPPVFDIWMRLLEAVPASVLWLAEPGAAARDNLQREAAQRGVGPLRLVFANRVPDQSEHLARYRLADLFLDTLPFNAHTTASDALWAGLPIITCAGSTYASRAAGSMLTAMRLGELITHSLQAYEDLALRLARKPALLQSYRERLAHNRQTAPLFDSIRFTRSLEHAFEKIHANFLLGRAPCIVEVPDA